MSLYHATKFAVEGFTEALSFELAAQSIGVKLIEPGRVKTNFSGSSMDFLFDESLTDYQAYVGSVRAAFGKLANPETESSPESVAEIIYQAATDGTKQLRYIVGEDAKVLLKLKEELDDEAFIQYFTGIFS